VHLVSSGRPGACADQLLIQTFQVFRLQTIEAVLADGRNDVLDHGRPVGGVARVAEIRLSDVLKPVVEPGGHRPTVARPLDCALFTMPF
jgi:hypothetical protein